MDTARQIVRWALPGWVAFLFWTGFMAVNTFLHGQSNPICLSILKKMDGLIVPLGIAAIPLGFVIYQLYYWVYWYVPVPSIAKRKFMDPVDRGKEILSGVKDHVDFGRIFYRKLNDAPPTAFRKWGPIYYKSVEVMNMYRENWHLSDSAWYLALSDDRYKNVAEYLERRNQMLGDIYHSLGACYHALGLAYSSYIVTSVYISFNDALTFLSSVTSFSLSIVFIAFTAMILRLASLFINSVVFLVMLRIFRGGRRASFDALLALKHDLITNVMLNKPPETD